MGPLFTLFSHYAKSKTHIWSACGEFAYRLQRSGQKIKPTISDISESVYASGIIKSLNQYEAYCPVSGIIDSVYVSEGDPVRKGFPILSVSNAVQRLNEENAKLSAAYADLHAQENRLKEAKLLVGLSRNKMYNDSLMYFRQRNLWRQQIGSRTELEQKDLAYENAKANYFSSRVRYQDLKRELDFRDSQSKKNLLISEKLADDYLLKSEMNGTVYAIYKEKGEIVNPQTPLAVVGDARKFIIEMQVDENDITKLKAGLPVKVALDSYKDQVFSATVIRINPLMNPRSRTFLVEAEFLKQPHKLYSNISLEANIVLSYKKSALIVPRNYVLNDSVRKSDGTKVKVKTGLRDYQKIEIVSGITDQDELIPVSP